MPVRNDRLTLCLRGMQPFNPGSLQFAAQQLSKPWQTWRAMRWLHDDRQWCIHGRLWRGRAAKCVRHIAATAGGFQRALLQAGNRPSRDPESITIDKSGANAAAVRSLVANSGLDIVLRQPKYLNNLIEHDHRAIKRRVGSMMVLQTFDSARTEATQGRSLQLPNERKIPACRG